MNTKNRLIENLLRVAKRHRILTYPVLALVALISIFSYFFNWSTGAGKRVVAVVMVMVMLVSQSYFLTSSAENGEDTTEDVTTQEELQAQNEKNTLIDDTAVNTPVVEVPDEKEEPSVEKPSIEESDTSNDSVATTPGENVVDTDTIGDSQNDSDNGTDDDTDFAEEEEQSDDITADGDSEPKVVFYIQQQPGGYNTDSFDALKGTLIKNPDGVTYTYVPDEEEVNNVLSSRSAEGCYTFDTWYSESQGGFKLDLNKLTPVNGKINLTALKSLFQYRVTIDRQGGEYSGVSGAESANATDVYNVKVADGGGASFKILKPTKIGCTIADSSVTASDGNGTNRVGGSATPDGEDLKVTLEGTYPYQTVMLVWEGGAYTVKYNLSDEPEPATAIQNLKYGDPAREVWRSADDVKKKDGYEFIGWKIKGHDELGTFKPSTNMSERARNILYKAWEESDDSTVVVPDYKYMAIKADDPGIEYQYMKPSTEDTFVKGYYVNDEGEKVENRGEDKFDYKIVSCTDGGTSVTYNEDGTLEGYDITVKTQKGGILVSTIGPKKVTSPGGITVNCKLIDKNAGEKETGDGSAEIDFTITIKVTPRIVHITSKDKFKKTYDATPDCNINGDLETDVTGITVTCSDGKYKDDKGNDTSDIGVHTVVLNNPKLKFSGDFSSEVQNNYVLDNYGDAFIVQGEITPRPVYVKTSAVNQYADVRDYVRAGEWETGNPQLKVEVDTDKNAIGGGGAFGFLNESDAKYLEQWVEAYPEPVRDDNSMTPEDATRHYSVLVRSKANADTDRICNYSFVWEADGTSAIGSFDVVLESPVLGTNYYFKGGNASGDGWYGQSSNIELRPMGGYDQIRVKGGKYEESLILTEENTKNGKITFQLRDSVSHAFTSEATIEVNVDLTAPKYIGFEITEGGTGNPGDGLYFPSKDACVSFGNYFNKSLRFEIEFQDELSGPKILYYTLSGNLGASQGVQECFFGDTDIDGKATAYIDIMAVDNVDKIGTIRFKAMDAAGNESGEYTLERNGTGEWVVEKTGPDISLFTVKSGEVTVHSDDGEYHSNCTAYVTASDESSGIYSVTWHVNGVDYEERVEDRTRKVREASFDLPVNDTNFPTAKGKGQGVYEVYATVTDNAGNTTDTKNAIRFMVDDVDPIVNIARDYDKYAQSVVLKFNAYDELSGVKYINIKDENGNMVHHEVERVEENDEGYMTSYCYVTITKRGKYTIVVEDYAGNKYEEIITLDKVSSDIPECPEVSVVPEANENDWITSDNTLVYITNKTETPIDQMSVKTYYKCWEVGTNEPSLAYETPGNTEIRLPEGIYNLHVWSQSLTGMKCSDADDHMYRLQVDGTAPTVEYQLQKGSGTSLLVSFTVTDAVSGVDRDSIRVMHGAESVLISLSELETGNGYIGSFEITEAGSYTIQAADIAGNEIKTEAFSPMSMKITAVKNLTETSATVGAWIIKGTYDIRTASIAYRKYTDTDYTETDAMPLLDTATGNMSISAILNGLEQGTEYVYKITAVSEGNEVLEYEGYLRTLSPEDVGIAITGTTRYADNRDGRITVGLLRGNYCIRAVVVDTEQGNSFTFINVPDGSYNLIATDGVFSKTVRVVIKNGRILYPETDFIELVLSGMSTSVEVQTEETPDISADFEFGANDDLMDGDNKLIDAGCTVEYKLTARLIRVSSVDTAALAAMYAVAGNNKIVGAYLDLTLYKYVTDEDGVVTRTRVSSLDAKGAQISVTIPLGDLAGKPGLMVVRIHQNGDTYTGRYLPDQDNNLSTYTVTTNQFSTYAVLYDGERSDDPTIDWFDPQYPGGDITGGGNSTSIKANTTSEERAIEEPDVKRSSVGTLTSSGSAKTGDEAPIAVAGIMMVIAMSGLFVLRRKTK